MGNAGQGFVGARDPLSSPTPIAIERGKKDKKTVAYTPYWPGWNGGANYEASAIEALEQYRERYRTVAERAGLGTSSANWAK